MLNEQASLPGESETSTERVRGGDEEDGGRALKPLPMVGGNTITSQVRCQFGSPLTRSLSSERNGRQPKAEIPWRAGEAEVGHVASHSTQRSVRSQSPGLRASNRESRGFPKVSGRCTDPR